MNALPLFLLAAAALTSPANAGTQAISQLSLSPLIISAPEPGLPAPAAADRKPGLSQADYNYLVWEPGDTGDWYEWWYYKVTVPGTDQAFYFCYGVVNPWDAAQSRPASRAYVSAGNFQAGRTHELKFPVTDFKAAASATFVRVGPHTATDRALKGSLPLPEGGEFSWDLRMEKEWSFNALGWTMYVPGITNIFWFPAQASARMSGTIKYGGREYLLSGAPAYQDRNWGRGFPRWWAWLVSNHFKNSPGTALAAGGGMPKVLGSFHMPNAMGIGLRHAGKEYAFRPSRGDLIKLDVDYGKWKVRALNKDGDRIEIDAWAPEEKFLLLKFMAPQGQEFYDYEALQGNIKVRLYKGAKLIADLETDEGGIEFGSGEPQDFSRLFTTEHKLQ